MKSRIKSFVKFIQTYLLRYPYLSFFICLFLKFQKTSYLYPKIEMFPKRRKDIIERLKNKISDAIRGPTVRLRIEGPRVENFQKCIFVLPQDFMNPKTHVGKGFLPVVSQIIKMLKRSFTQFELIEIPSRMSETVKSDYVSKLRKAALSHDLTKVVGIIFSPTYLIQKVAFSTIWREVSELFDLRVAYLSSSGTKPGLTVQSLLKLSNVDLVIDYNPNSELIKNPEFNLRIDHVPWVPTDRILVNRGKNISISFSGLHKHNRFRWLVVLNRFGRITHSDTNIRLYSEEAIRHGWQKFLPRDDLHDFFSDHSLGLVLLNRSPGFNDGLIGSFWDVYYAGAVPLVQFEGSDYRLSSYLTPYRDYLPFSTDIELYSLVNVLKENPELLAQLKALNLLRRQTDLNLHNVGEVLSNKIHQEALQ